MSHPTAEVALFGAKRFPDLLTVDVLKEGWQLSVFRDGFASVVVVGLILIAHGNVGRTARTNGN